MNNHDDPTPWIGLRPAAIDDAQLLFEWVNQPDSLSRKLQAKGPIALADHMRWFTARLTNADCRIWIAQVDGADVGQVRVERKGPGLEVDVFVVAEQRRRGVAKGMIEAAARESALHWPGQALIARIKPDNLASQRLFAAAGYAEKAKHSDHVEYALQMPTPTDPPRRKFALSNQLYERALKTIPLASQTFSKSAMNFVRGASPLFLDRGDGCRVWDVDGNEYIDYVLALMPVVLGYRDPDVDAAVRRQLDKGIIFSLSTELEIELAERLVRLIPCAEMVRFGKNGSDATSAAVRLARAHTGRDRIGVCGYHGWHDWYIGTTTRSLGVPPAVRALSTTFPYGDVEFVERMLAADPNGFAAVVLEPVAANGPSVEFLRALRALTERYGVVLIFDEIVSGFRMDLGGAQRTVGVTPDLAAFGKAMANGMPIAAVVGRRDIMRRMEDIFFSGTFGGEALSLAASIATIDKLEKLNGPARIEALGRRLIAGINAILTPAVPSASITGMGWHPMVTVAESDPARRVTVVSLLRQELVANGILAGGGINTSLAHDNEAVVSATVQAWRNAATAVAAALASGTPERFLRGDLIRPVFQVRAT